MPVRLRRLLDCELINRGSTGNLTALAANRGVAMVTPGGVGVEGRVQTQQRALVIPVEQPQRDWGPAVLAAQRESGPCRRNQVGSKDHVSQDV